MKHIYLDNNASTHVNSEVIAEMLPLLQDNYGNPSSSHQLGADAKEVLETSRRRVSALLGCNPQEVIFTSGGTESNNLAIRGFAQKLAGSFHFITSVVEHPSVLENFRFLEQAGHQVTYLPVDQQGLITPEEVEKAITPATVFISLMLANNETGVIFPIQDIGLIAQKYGITFHCDAVQGVGKLPWTVGELNVDLLSISAHKIHGPKGAGVLYIRKPDLIYPLILGGGQENGKRSGTEGLPAIAGLGKACEIAADGLMESMQRMAELRDRLEKGILKIFPNAAINGSRSLRLCNTTNIRFPGICSAGIIAALSNAGVYVSHRSACSSRGGGNSRVLKAMGLIEAEISSSIRFSLSKETTPEEIDETLWILNRVINSEQVRCMKGTCQISTSEVPEEVTPVKDFEKELNELWKETTGDPRICIAVLDGPVDLNHPSFDGARLDSVNTLVSAASGEGPASAHGTHVSSIIFGQHKSPVRGIAPGCRGLIVPVFSDSLDGSTPYCSQLDLARAIMQAVREGAHIINISGGQLALGGESEAHLAQAVRICAENGVLIVAAAGNDGCECLHVPATLPAVLAVGAMDSAGKPLESSNWGKAYQVQGILAPGDSIAGAVPGGGVASKSGTSFAAPIVSGIVALFMSMQLKHNRKADPMAIRDAILKSAYPCDGSGSIECRRFLAGRINIRGAWDLISRDFKNEPGFNFPETGMRSSPVKNVTAAEFMQICEANRNSNEPNTKTKGGLNQMNYEETNVNPSNEEIQTIQNMEGMATSMNQSAAFEPAQVTPSGCSYISGSGNGRPELVYVIGTIGYDYGTEARRDYFRLMGVINPDNPNDLMDYLEKEPQPGKLDHASQAASIIWTLNQEETPIYAIQPSGVFGDQGYKLLREYLKAQLKEGVERVSVPGFIAGKVTLMNGQVVPVIVPEARGMYCWSIKALVDAIVKQFYPKDDKPQDRFSDQIKNFLARVYYEVRNLGLTPQERAINYSATNLAMVAQIIIETLDKGMQLDSITSERSPVCRPNSDCWDVKLTFFNPTKRYDIAKLIYRFTVDVSDFVPVSVGKVRSWYAY